MHRVQNTGYKDDQGTQLIPQQHKKISETKDTLIEIKTNLQGYNSRVDEAENHIKDLEHKEVKINQSEQEEKGIQKNEKNISSLWDNFKRSKIRIIGVPEEEEKEQEIGNLFEKPVKENFPNLVKESRHASPGSTENPKQDRCKEDRTLEDTS